MSSGLTNDFPQPNDVYRHQNGIDYRVDAIARVDNDYQELVVVATGPDGITWARPIGNFLGLKDGKARFEKVGTKFVHPGVSFSGRLGEFRSVVCFTKGSAHVVTDSLGALAGHTGTWVINADGSLSMGVKSEEAVKPYAIINGVVYLTQAELEKSWLNLSELKISDPLYTVRVSQADNGKPYVCGMQLSDECHWNKPEDLPPVGCDLLIKVPAGTKVYLGDPHGVNVSYDTDVDRTFKVFRTSHLADRAGDMEYRLPDNSIVTGRFPWTYP